MSCCLIRSGADYEMNADTVCKFIENSNTHLRSDNFPSKSGPKRKEKWKAAVRCIICPSFIQIGTNHVWNRLTAPSLLNVQSEKRSDCRRRTGTRGRVRPLFHTSRFHSSVVWEGFVSKHQRAPRNASLRAAAICVILLSYHQLIHSPNAPALPASEKFHLTQKSLCACVGMWAGVCVCGYSGGANIAQ